MIDKRDFVRWVRGYRAAERRIDAERRSRILPPAESLDKAIELGRLARELGVTRASSKPLSEEDLRVYRKWRRLRVALRRKHA